MAKLLSFLQFYTENGILRLSSDVKSSFWVVYVQPVRLIRPYRAFRYSNCMGIHWIIHMWPKHHFSFTRIHTIRIICVIMALKEWKHYNQINERLVQVFIIFWQKYPACSFLLDSPQVTESDKTISVSLGNSATLTCPVDGNPPPSVEWYQRNVINVQTLRRGKTWEINNATLSDSGLYTCSASNPVGSVTATVILKVGE